MKKYDDLLYCKNIDNELMKSLQKEIEANESKFFYNIWDSLCLSDTFNKRIPHIQYEKIKIDSNNIFSFYETINNPKSEIEKILKETNNSFEICFSLLADSLTLYDKDIHMALTYNYCLKNREEKATEDELRVFWTTITDTQKIDKFITIKDSDSILDTSKYYLPFSLKHNAYKDFCSFTWKSIHKDLDSINCFKKNTGRMNPNLFTFDRIFHCLTYPNESITINDQWLIEKISGVNTIMLLMPAVTKYYSNQTMKNIYIPLLLELLKCKPIYIRAYLAMLVNDFLFIIQSRNSNSPLLNNVNDIFNPSIVHKIKCDLEKAVERININYCTLLQWFHESKVKLNSKIEIDISSKDETNSFIYKSQSIYYNLELDAYPKIEEYSPIVFLNIPGLSKIANHLLSCPKKRTYNGSDDLFRYAKLQKKAIEFNYNNFLS